MSSRAFSSLKERIEKSAHSQERKERLLSLVSSLEAELDEVSRTSSQDARSIASFAEASMTEATRDTPHQEALKHSLIALGLSVKRVEAEYPETVKLVNAISMMLSNTGI